MARATGDGPTLSAVLATAWATLDGRDRFAEKWVEHPAGGAGGGRAGGRPRRLAVGAAPSSSGPIAAARRGGRRPVPPRRGRAPSPTGSASPAFAGTSQHAGHARRPRRGPRPGRALHDGGPRGRSVLRPDRVVRSPGSRGACSSHPQRPGTDRRADPCDGGPGPDPARTPVWRLGAGRRPDAVRPRGGGPGALRLAGRRRLRPRTERHRLPGDPLRPRSMCLLLGVDKATAASIYDQLLPHAGTFNWAFAIVAEPNDLGLAGAAWAAGEPDVADHHFAASVELCERAGARPDLAGPTTTGPTPWRRAAERRGQGTR